VLIARVIAEPAGLSSHVDALLEALSDEGAPPMRARSPAAWSKSWPRAWWPPCARRSTRIWAGDALITEHRPVVPRLFVSDMDSTMISAECIDELADFAGLKPQIAAITERAMQGELDFREALTERVAAEGPVGRAIAQCLAERIAPMKGARTLVQTLKAKGAAPCWSPAASTSSPIPWPSSLVSSASWATVWKLSMAS
jgi:phosphoserine phosphatase